MAKKKPSRRKTDDFRFLAGILFVGGIAAMIILLNQHTTSKPATYHRQMICTNIGGKLKISSQHTSKRNKEEQIIVITCSDK